MGQNNSVEQNMTHIDKIDDAFEYVKRDDSTQVKILEGKKESLIKINHHLKKEISDRRQKLNNLDEQIKAKQIDLERYDDELKKLKTEYFRLKDVASEFKYNSRYGKRSSTTSLNKISTV